NHVKYSIDYERISDRFQYYRVRINSWRRATQFPTALIGPTPEVKIWEDSDFTTIIDFDEFIEQCTTEHRAHLKAQREAKKKKTNQQIGRASCRERGKIYIHDGGR